MYYSYVKHHIDCIRLRKKNFTTNLGEQASLMLPQLVILARWWWKKKRAQTL